MNLFDDAILSFTPVRRGPVPMPIVPRERVDERLIAMRRAMAQANAEKAAEEERRRQQAALERAAEDAARAQVEWMQRILAESGTILPPVREKEIIRECAAEAGLPVAALKSASRKQVIVNARHKAMYRIRTETTFTLPQIGRFFGNRDHTTVLHGCRAHAARFHLPDPCPERAK